MDVKLFSQESCRKMVLQGGCAPPSQSTATNNRVPSPGFNVGPGVDQLQPKVCVQEFIARAAAERRRKAIARWSALATEVQCDAVLLRQTIKAVQLRRASQV